MLGEIKLDINQGSRIGLNAVVIFPDEKRFLSISNRNTVKIFTIENGVEINVFKLDESKWIHDLAITPDEKYLITASGNGTVKLWNIQQLIEQHNLDGFQQSKSLISSTYSDHTDSITSIAITSDGKKAISASRDHTLKVWNIKKELLLTFNGHNSDVEAVAIIPNSQRAISASEDQVLKVWDINTGKELLTITLQFPLRYLPNWSGLAITPDGLFVVTFVTKFKNNSSDETLLMIFNLETGEEQYSIPINLGFPIVSTFTLTPDGQHVIVSALTEETIHILDLETGETLLTLEADYSVDEVVVTPDGQYLISSDDGGGIKVWDLKSGAELYTLRNSQLGSMNHFKLAIEPKGRYLFSVGEVSAHEPDSNSLRVWDLYSGEIIASFTGDSPLYAVAVASDGLTVVVGTDKGQVHFLQLKGIKNNSQKNPYLLLP